MSEMTRVKPPSPTPGPAGDTVPRGSTKSGYAKDVRPDLVNMEEAAGRVVPIASESGRQSGRVAPSQRKTVNYKAVTPAEADSLLRGRLQGTVPKIAGGLDEANPSQYDDTRMEARDSSEATPPSAPVLDVTKVDDVQQFLLQLKPLLAQLRPVEHVGLAANGTIIEHAPKAAEPVVRAPVARERVQLQVEGAGTYSVPAIDVVKAGFGILVLLPCGTNDATFTPSPGASVRVVFRGKVHDCYFPGVAGELPGMNVMVLAMIDKTEQAGA